MNATLWHQLDLAARRMTPALVTLAAVLLGRVPFHIPEAGAVTPWFTLIAVFYWAAHQPGLMPNGAVFALALFHDLLMGAPLGVGVIVLLSVHMLVAGQGRFFTSRSFSVVWITFACVAVVAILAYWLLAMAAAGTGLSPQPALFRLLTTVAAYPPLTWLLAHIQRAVVR